MPHFRYEPSKPKLGEMINFYPSTRGIVYIWNFGDGTITTGSIVTHVYQRPGAYYVTAGDLEPQVIIIPPSASASTAINIRYVL